MCLDARAVEGGLGASKQAERIDSVRRLAHAEHGDRSSRSRCEYKATEFAKLRVKTRPQELQCRGLMARG